MSLAAAIQQASAPPADPPPVVDDSLGLVREETAGQWRWFCGKCPGQSVGTYPTFLAVWDGLRRHDEAVAGRLH